MLRSSSLGAVLLAAGGCLSLAKIVPCPLAVAEQVTSIRELIAPGMSRGEVLNRLQEAGIDGAFGSNESIYYCDLWEQPSGARWHIDVAILFDEQGRYYGTRPEPATVRGDAPREPEQARDAQPAPTLPPEIEDDPFAHEPDGRNGRRTPFDDQ